MSKPTFTPWDAWYELHPDDWQQAVGSLTIKAAAGQRKNSSSYRELREYVDKMFQTDWPLGSHLEGALIGAWTDALELGATIGYALARTQPGSLDEFENWPRRAMELAGLKIQPDAEEEEQP